MKQQCSITSFLGVTPMKLAISFLGLPMSLCFWDYTERNEIRAKVIHSVVPYKNGRKYYIKYVL
jgi:hypothetical protein